MLAAVLFALDALLAFVYYPRNTDPVLANSATAYRKDYVAFYDDAYKSPGSAADPSITKSYPTRSAAPETIPLCGTGVWIKAEIEGLIRQYNLKDKRALEIGAGSGELQDVIQDYTGLDISSNAARFFHKRFVQGSATDLPFKDNTFDVAWTVHVLEHVPKPEQALNEMRRVVRSGGYIYLAPRWQAPSWAADGYDARPYSAFNWAGKINKASILFRDTRAYRASWTVPIRALRYLGFAATRRPTAFRYTALRPNYTHYWEADSDAINNIDNYEAILWHVSRGDTCVNFDTLVKQLLASGPVVIRVQKPAPPL